MAFYKALARQAFKQRDPQFTFEGLSMDWRTHSSYDGTMPKSLFSRRGQEVFVILEDNDVLKPVSEEEGYITENPRLIEDKLHHLFPSISNFEEFISTLQRYYDHPFNPYNPKNKEVMNMVNKFNERTRMLKTGKTPADRLPDISYEELQSLLPAAGEQGVGEKFLQFLMLLQFENPDEPGQVHEFNGRTPGVSTSALPVEI